MIEVTQTDRETAANYLQSITDDGHTYDAIRRWQCDNHPLVQAFAAHRIAAEKEQRERDAVIADGWTENSGIISRTGMHIAQAIRTQP